jgi:MinD-like ATPase involved in chromosome partitioning or flagellar assembly
VSIPDPYGAVPDWPKVSATITEDGTAEVTINGSPRTVLTGGGDVDQARAAVLEHLSVQTAGLGRPLRVETVDPDGHSLLVVHPDGRVLPLDEQPPDSTARAWEQVAPGPLPGSARRTKLGRSKHGPLRDALGARTAGSEALEPATPTNPESLGETMATDPTPVPPASTASSRSGPIIAPGERLTASGLPIRPTAPGPAAPASASAGAPATSAIPTIPEPSATNRMAKELGVPQPKPTLPDLLATRPPAPSGPAQDGWQGLVRRITGGLVSPVPSPAELEYREAVASVQRSLRGPKTVVVVNPKGGANKTTASLLIAATFGMHRGGYTLAWDNNETRGTLGWRANPARHSNTAVDLLRDLDRFTDVRSSRVGDLDNYVRSQGSAQFDVLASDEDAASAASIDDQAFDHLHKALARFYRVLVVDTGNNMRASNWQAAVNAADQLVIVSTIREDTAASAAWLADGLAAAGKADVVHNAVTVLSSPGRRPDPALHDRLHSHFGSLTRVVLDVPHDPALVSGGPITYDALSPSSRTAWLRVTAAIADGL